MNAFPHLLHQPFMTLFALKCNPKKVLGFESNKFSIAFKHNKSNKHNRIAMQLIAMSQY
jgi:N-acyl-L-homoserine lactone synthetase